MAWTIAAALALVLASPQTSSETVASVSVTLGTEKARAKAKDVHLVHPSPLAIQSEVVEQTESTVRLRLTMRAKTGTPRRIQVGHPITGRKDLDLRQFMEVKTLAGGSVEVKNSQGESMHLGFPQGIALDPNGTLYIADPRNGRILTLRGSVLNSLVTLPAPLDLSIANSRLYVLNNPGTLLRFTLDGQTGELMAGDGLLRDDFPQGLYGQPSPLDGEGKRAGFGHLGQLVARGDQVFIRQNLSFFVRVVTNLQPERAAVRSIRGAALLSGGIDVIGLAQGTVIVTARGSELLLLDMRTGDVLSIAGSSKGGHRDGFGHDALFASISDIMVEGRTIYVIEEVGRRLRQVTLEDESNPLLPASWLVKTLAGSGEKGEEDGSGGQASFLSPLSLTGDGQKKLILSDADHNQTSRPGSIRQIAAVKDLALPLGGMLDQATMESALPSGSESPEGLIYEVAGEAVAIELVISTKKPVLSFDLPITLLAEK